MRPTPLIALAATLIFAGSAHAAQVRIDGTPSNRSSLRVELVTNEIARSAPRPGARPVMRVNALSPFGQDTTRLLVTARRRDRNGVWYRVLLPKRPNGSQGWIRGDRVRVYRNPLRIAISLSRRSLVVKRSGRTVLRARVAIGRAGAPTPTGRFAIAENIRTNAPGSYLGAHVLALTSFSPTLKRFRGGNARIAIHGTQRPGLIGSRASHGCLWLARHELERLARTIPAGTPVTIRP